MVNILKRFFVLFLCVCVFLALPLPVSAEPEESEQAQEAENITHYSLVTDSKGFSDLRYAFDGREGYPGASASSYLTLSYADGIGSLYLEFRREYGEYILVNNDTGVEHICGEYSFLHDFLDLVAIFGTAPSSVTLRFETGKVRLNNLYAFTTGETPDFVQKWQPPADGNADMILFSTHGDDDQLFFAGLLPYYANAKDYTVQVIYLTNHRNENDARVHEMLNGLWAVGCDTYPVFGQYYDFLYDNIKQTYRAFEHLGHPREEMVGFVVEQLRRFKPLVTVGHDFAGEYGHGQHMVYADLVAEAVTVSNNPEYYPESAEKYGLWDVPKSYFHLYEDNPIVMDWDTPMEELDGMTPFEVTQKLGFPAHVSQQRAWFKYWLCRGGDITKASQIETYSPCLYGLYRSTVGPDTGLNDMFENVTPYSQVVEPEPEVIPEETQPEIVPLTPTAPPVAIPAPAVPKKQPELWIIAAGGIILVVVLVILSVLLRKRHKN